MSIENGRRRAQDRINLLFPNARHRPDLSRLQWQNEAPALGSGFLHSIEDWCMSVSRPCLVVIDVLQTIKPSGNPARNAYENDYSIFPELQEWALRHTVGVVGLHHTRKGGADDPLEALSGSNGLSACADTTLVLDKDSSGTSLYVRGRDVLEKKSSLRFLEGQWIVTGDAADVTTSTERGNILQALLESEEAMSPSEVADVTGMKRGNVRKLLLRCREREKRGNPGVDVTFTPQGKVFRVPPVTSVTSVTFDSMRTKWAGHFAQCYLVTDVTGARLRSKLQTSSSPGFEQEGPREDRQDRRRMLDPSG